MTVFRAATLRTFFFAFHAGAKELRDVVESSRQVRLLCSWRRRLTGYPYRYVEDRCLKHLGNRNSQASANIPPKRQRYNSLSGE